MIEWIFDSLCTIAGTVCGELAKGVAESKLNNRKAIENYIVYPELVSYGNNKEFEGGCQIQWIDIISPPTPKTPSKKKRVMKYYIQKVKAGYIYRVYKKLDLKKGDIVEVNVFSHHTTNATVNLMAYSETLGYEIASEPQELDGSDWKRLRLEISDDAYNYINLEVKPRNDIGYNENEDGTTWEGTDLFIDDFKIIRN